MLTAVIPLALAHLASRCAPTIGPITMIALVTYESGGRPFAIGDNTDRRAYFPSDRRTAERIATQLSLRGHSIDLGYAQINSANFARFGLSVASALEPCSNIATGARILAGAYAGARRRFGPGQRALFHALSAYNTGGYFAGSTYARGVYATAATLRYDTLGGSAR